MSKQEPYASTAKLTRLKIAVRETAMVMFNEVVPLAKGKFAAGICLCCMLTNIALAQSAPEIRTAPASSSVSAPSVKSSPYRPAVPNRARDYYQLVWGVEALTVRSVESGELIRFNFRVVDAAKAQPLNDKKSEPFLLDERARVKLVIPSLEKVGQLRQSSTPEPGKVYWMAFSNKGGLVKRGDRVSVVIGTFRADGLVVE